MREMIQICSGILDSQIPGYQRIEPRNPGGLLGSSSKQKRNKTKVGHRHRRNARTQCDANNRHRRYSTLQRKKTFRIGRGDKKI